MCNSNKIIYENDIIYCTYKKKGEHTLLSSDSSEDDSLCLYRLDECTSGILVYAKNKRAYDYLKELQKQNKIIKTYKAITEKRDTELVNESFLTIKNSIEKASDKLSFVVSSYFRPFGVGHKAVRVVPLDTKSKYKNKDVTKNIYSTTIINYRNNVFTVQITKGFRHQIRSHLATLGYPIVGDTMYGYNGVIGTPPKSIELECVQIEFDDTKISL